MRLTHWLVSAIGAAALGFVAIPAQATPAGALTGNIAAQEAGADVEQVRHRCYRHRGDWHCPRHRHNRVYGYYGYAPYYNPGFSIYIGPRHRHHRRWH